jgi:hypothetical protein
MSTRSTLCAVCFLALGCSSGGTGGFADASLDSAGDGVGQVGESPPADGSLGEDGGLDPDPDADATSPDVDERPDAFVDTRPDTIIDTGPDTVVDTRPDTVVDAAPETVEPPPARIGESCARADCAAGLRCTSDLPDPLFPEPVCIGPCTPAAGPSFCDGIRGLCVPVGSGGACVPACRFDSGVAASGCLGRDLCIPYVSTTSTEIFGLCDGYCVTNNDCDHGVCQPETGNCVATRRTYTKTVGASCVQGANDCYCMQHPDAANGVCTRVCRSDGGSACPTGFSCDAQLPTAYTAIPAGVQGHCLKNCTTDADCTGLGSKCLQSGGVARKTCQPSTP